MLSNYFSMIYANGHFDSARVFLNKDKISTIIVNKEKTMMGFVEIPNVHIPIGGVCEIGLYDIGAIVKSLKSFDEKKTGISIEFDENNLYTKKPLFLCVKEGRKLVKFALKNLELPEFKKYEYLNPSNHVTFSLKLTKERIKEIKTVSTLNKTDHVFMMCDTNKFTFLFSDDYKKVQNSSSIYFEDGWNIQDESIQPVKIPSNQFLNVISSFNSDVNVIYNSTRNMVEFSYIDDKLTQKYIVMSMR